MKKAYIKTIIAGFLVYFFSYAMRLDYAASLVAIVQDLQVSNTAASAAITGSFITYGIGQVLCGFIGDKISPTKMISFAMAGTIAVNVAVSFSSSVLTMTVLWCLNGFFQAMIWPPLTRFVSEQVGAEKYADAITVVGLSAQVGTIFVYLFVPAVLSVTAWRNVFRLISLFGGMILLMWCIMSRQGAVSEGAPLSERKAVVPQKEKAERGSIIALILTAGLLPVFAVIVLQGVLRDGIQTWLPSLISKQFHIEAAASVLSTVVMPIFSMLSVVAANTVYHFFGSELKTSAMFFGISFVAAIPLALGIPFPPMVTVVMASVVSACMHGVNHMLIAIIPKHFARYGLVSTFSGILNAFTYIGASVSTYGFAVLADHRGWNAVLTSWCVVAFLGTAICFWRIPKWRRFIQREAEEESADR